MEGRFIFVWKPQHLCGGRSALALRDSVPTLITRFSAGAKDFPMISGKKSMPGQKSSTSGASYAGVQYGTAKPVEVAQD